MNQILYTGDERIQAPVKKQKKVLPINTIVLFFAISIIILGICIITGSIYSKIKINETVEASIEPEITIERDDDWKGFRIQGILDFSLIGILSRISSLLAEAEIGIFAVSTYNTDYILTKKENFESALEVLRKAGYTILK